MNAGYIFRVNAKVHADAYMRSRIQEYRTMMGYNLALCVTSWLDSGCRQGGRI